MKRRILFKLKRASNTQEIEHARQILTEALKDSMGIHWVMKNKSELGKILALEVLFYEGADKDGVYLSDDNNGAVVFYDINDSRKSRQNALRKFKLVWRHSGVQSVYRLLRYRKMISSTRPKQAMVGFLVGTDRSVKGTKAIFDIHRGMQDIAANLKLPICLETTLPRVRRLYQFAGYTEYASKTHPYADLEIYFFIKHPDK
jgi:hypothetical protein